MDSAQNLMGSMLDQYLLTKKIGEDWCSSIPAILPSHKQTHTDTHTHTHTDTHTQTNTETRKQYMSNVIIYA